MPQNPESLEENPLQKKTDDTDKVDDEFVHMVKEFIEKFRSALEDLAKT